MVLKSVLSGWNFDYFASTYNERKKTKDKNGKLGFITSKQYGNIGKIALTMDAGTVYNELIPSKNGSSIIKVLNKQPARIKPYNSVKSKVRSDYRRITRLRLDSDLYNKLKSKYNLNIYWDSLNMK